MASEIIPFSPSPSANFQFQATLDGATYNCVCTWNVYGQRYYLSIYDLAQNLILSRPLVGSPDTANISLTAGYFDTTLVYRDSRAVFEIPGNPPQPLITRPPAPPTPPPPPPPPPPPGPLDAYQANAIYAFARKKLFGSWAGALYRARRSTDNAEQDIYAGLDGKDTQSIAEFAGTASAYLVKWYDQSGAGLHLSQIVNADQPLIVNAGTVLENFQPDGASQYLVSAGSTVTSYVGSTQYFTGIPAPAIGSGTPVITGIFGTSKAALITFAPLSGGNDGIQPSIGDAHGNTANHGTIDDSYCVPFDTSQPTIGGQAPLYAGSTLWGYRGDSGTPDNNPIGVGPITYGCNPSGSSGNFSPARLRAIVGYSVTHDLATLSAINAILVA